jgi:uncharacterized membrane protein
MTAADGQPIKTSGERRNRPPGNVFLALMIFMMAVFFQPNGKATAGTLTLMQNKLTQGIDFFAVGNEPSWSLDVDKEKAMRFKSLTELSELNMPPGRQDKAQDADVTRYFSQSGAGTLIATVSRRTCEDTMSGESFPFYVRAEVKRTEDEDYMTFEGCGRYVADVRINDSWVLTHFGDRKLQPEDFAKGLPVVEFHLKDNQVVGHTGCNRISGWFEARGEKVTFGNLATTRMACPNMAFEHELLSAITRKTLRTTIDDGRLLLIDDTGIVLTFGKTD